MRVAIMWLISAVASALLLESSIHDFWHDQSIAEVKIDTLKEFDDFNTSGGILLCNTEREVLVPAIPESSFEKATSLVGNFGNFFFIKENGITKAVTAQHVVERSLLPNHGGWQFDPDRDLAIKDTFFQNQLRRYILPMTVSMNLDGMKVQIIGYRKYSVNGNISMLRFKITGYLQKLPFLYANICLRVDSTANALSWYTIRIPFNLYSEIPGLSGSPVYLVDKNGKRTNTVVAVLIRRYIYPAPFQKKEEEKAVSIIVEGL
jgi:hypothetical protein